MSNQPVFISHASEDKTFVERLAHDLIVRGVQVWYAEWEIKVGESIVQKVNEGIDSSGSLLVVLSEASTRSAWVSRELSAALMLELERKNVFVLPVRLDDAPVPTLLKDKLYADFRKAYDAGLDRLLGSLIPESASSAMLRSVPELKLHYLPAMTKGRLVVTFDLNRVLLAINALEKHIGLSTSNLPLYSKGQRMTFREINRLLPPIDAVRARLGLDLSWEWHPVRGGEMYSAAHMNELYGKINEAIDVVFRTSVARTQGTSGSARDTA